MPALSGFCTGQCRVQGWGLPLVLLWEGTGTGAGTNVQASANAESLKVWLRSGPHDSLRDC